MERTVPLDWFAEANALIKERNDAMTSADLTRQANEARLDASINAAPGSDKQKRLLAKADMLDHESTLRRQSERPEREYGTQAGRDGYDARLLEAERNMA